MLGIENFDFNHKYGKIICTLVLAISVICTSVASVKTYFEKSLRPVPELKEVCEFLVYNDLYEGYASFWDGNVLSEWSNGQIEVWAANYYEFSFPSIVKSLQVVNHDNPPEGRFFLILNEEEVYLYGIEDIENYSTIGYVKDGYIVLIYESFDDLKEAISKTDIILNEKYK